MKLFTMALFIVALIGLTLLNGCASTGSLTAQAHQMNHPSPDQNTDDFIDTLIY
ncbi:MAG: hypothetical protein JXR73_22060 [Candidatus Omnitrophica bacterium]|nr:hypothetical protein [Candidatus Omnitrophota bacterium]